MFEKYLKIIQNSKEKHLKIKTFLESLNIKCYIDIIDKEVILKIDSFDIFVFEENKEKIVNFLKENDLKLRDF